MTHPPSNGPLSAPQSQPSDLHVRGAAALQRGDYGQAMDLLKKAIAADPGFPEAHHDLANTYMALGQWDDALKSFQDSIAINPHSADAHANMGNAFFNLGRFADSIDCYQRLISLITPPSDAPKNVGGIEGSSPDSLQVSKIAQAHFNIGNALLSMGGAGDAIPRYETALSLQPDYIDALNNLSVAYRQSGDDPKALDCLEKIIRISPDYVKAHINLGDIHLALEHFEAAIQCYEKAISLDPGQAVAQNNLGLAYTHMKRFEEAVARYKIAININPDFSLAFFNLGNAHGSLANPDEAVACYEAAIRINPNDADIHGNLGSLQRKIGHLSDSLENLENAIRVRPDSYLAFGNMGLTLHFLGRIEDSVEHHRAAVELAPTNADAHSNLIYSMQFLPEISGEALLEESLKWDALHSAPARTTRYSNTPDPDRRLRVGYVSADFNNHAVAYFLEPLVRGHNREAVEVFCYPTTDRYDAVTERFMAHADVWRPTVDMTHDEFNQVIRDDRIDIIVECTGRTSSNRLLFLSQKPAPIQVNYLAMHGETSGMACMDYALSDSIVTPPSVEHQLSEKLLLLKHGSFIFQPDTGWPDVAPPRGPDEAPVFGCVGAPHRVSDAAIELWARLLEMVPGARLLFKHPDYTEPKTRAHWQHKFERLAKWAIFEGVGGGWRQHMDVYGRIDVVLDSYPMTGATSCLIPLWMGVPVLILAAPFYGHRGGSSVLTNAGMSAFVIEDADAYLKTAADLVQDRDRLAQLRTELRDRVRASPLCDAQSRVEDIEAAYRKIWRTWCAEQGQTPT